ncbi:MATE family efflux transporter [Hydrotalea sp.]|uniref:MATE family efflux transporter n=1 Tax=Hydrotalea sp. TaxID=2881279 RepID=UPI00259031AC|nr:MATE family efflux transporter [Hydrotalea sp.]
MNMSEPAIVTADYRVTTSNQQILKIALPIAAATLVPQLNFIINNVFLGHLGEQPLAVAGITGVYYLIFAVIGIGLNNGMQAIIARRAGENKIEAIGNLFAQGVRISFVLAFLGILITWFLVPVILEHTLSNPLHVSMAVKFLRIRIFGLIFLYLYQLRNAVLVGTNQSKYLIIGTAAESIANVFFDYVLIYGKWGFPNLGFDGAAYSSIIAEFTGLMAIYFVIRKKGIDRQLQLFKSWEFDKNNITLILRLSAPLIAQFCLSIVSWEFFYILIEHHGSMDLAISNIMRNIFGFFGCFTWAFAAAANTMVSNIIGQGLHIKVEGLIIKIMKLSGLFAGSICIIINIFPTLFLSFYGQGNDFIMHAIPVLRVVSTALVLMSVSTIWLNAVTGTGSTQVNLLIEFFAIIMYCLYSYFILEKWHLPITVGWGSEWVYWILLFIPSYWYIKKGSWQQKQF